MLEQEVAALIHFMEPLGLKNYFKELPEDFVTPSAFFPPPEIDGEEHSLSTYANTFSLFIKIFDRSSLESSTIASQLVKAIQNRRKLIPLYDENGKLTGKNFRVTKLNAKNIDEGVTQISIAWKTLTAYDEETYTKAAQFYYGGLATSREQEE